MPKKKKKEKASEPHRSLTSLWSQFGEALQSICKTDKHADKTASH